MKRNASTVSSNVLRPLRATWEANVSAGLRQATDVELLWMLDEIEAQLGERHPACETVRTSYEELPEEIPDWDDKSPEELEAIIRELEEELAVADAPREAAAPVQKPHARRGGRVPHTAEVQAARLRCEELEPRYPPTAVVMVWLRPAPAVALVSTWNAVEVRAADTAFVATPNALASSALLPDDTAGELARALVA